MSRPYLSVRVTRERRYQSDTGAVKGNAVRDREFKEIREFREFREPALVFSQSHARAQILVRRVCSHGLFP